MKSTSNGKTFLFSMKGRNLYFMIIQDERNKREVKSKIDQAKILFLHKTDMFRASIDLKVRF